MGKVIGIDLGTTNSCVAIIEGNESRIIPNSEGSMTTPSIVAFNEDNERLVGLIAKRQAVTNPENTVFSVKRLIGRRFRSTEVAELQKTLPYELKESPEGEVLISIFGKNYSPAEISAIILQKMRESAEDYLGETVTEAVVTVPAYFDDAQRQGTKDAGRIAGLDVLRIINEPTAASLVYGLDKKKSQRVAIYDLGGGTFDISIMEIGDGVFEVLATNGNTYLGGDDFDQAIIVWILDEFERKEGISLKHDRMALQRLKESAEMAKCELSTLPETEINLPFICSGDSGPKHLKMTLAREQLEEMALGLVEETIDPCRQAMEDAGLRAEDLDQLLLVGGQTRMPLVTKMAEEFFQRKALKGINPDEIVAGGAAIQAGVLRGEVKDVLLLDVTPLSLGIETFGGIFTKIIDRNSTIPIKRSQIFSTAEDNQSIVAIHVLQGERDLASHNQTLGRFELIGIPPAPRGVPQIEVTFSIDANGIVNVTAQDLGTHREQTIRITNAANLSEEEIERIRREAETFAQEDKIKRELIQSKNKARTLVFTTRNSLIEYGDRLSPEERDELNYLIELTNKSLLQNDIQVIEENTLNLSKASHALANRIYTQGGTARGTFTTPPRPKTDDGASTLEPPAVEDLMDPDL